MWRHIPVSIVLKVHIPSTMRSTIPIQRTVSNKEKDEKSEHQNASIWNQKAGKHLLTASYSLSPNRESCRISAYASSIGLYQSFGYQILLGCKDPSCSQISFPACASSHVLFYLGRWSSSGSTPNVAGSPFVVDVFEMQLPSPSFVYIHPILTGQVRGLIHVSVHLNTNVWYISNESYKV